MSMSIKHGKKNIDKITKVSEKSEAFLLIQSVPDIAFRNNSLTER